MEKCSSKHDPPSSILKVYVSIFSYLYNTIEADTNFYKELSGKIGLTMSRGGGFLSQSGEALEGHSVPHFSG